MGKCAWINYLKIPNSVNCVQRRPAQYGDYPPRSQDYFPFSFFRQNFQKTCSRANLKFHASFFFILSNVNNQLISTDNGRTTQHGFETSIQIIKTKCKSCSSFRHARINAWPSQLVSEKWGCWKTLQDSGHRYFSLGGDWIFLSDERIFEILDCFWLPRSGVNIWCIKPCLAGLFNAP